MSTTTKVLILAAIAAYLLREQLAHALGFGTTAAPPALAPPADASSPTPTPASTNNPPDMWQQIKAAGEADDSAKANNGLLTPYHWNYYYEAYSGRKAPGMDAIGQGDGTTAISFEAYKSAITRAGLAGLAAAAIAPQRPRVTAQAVSRKAWNYAR